MEFTPHEYQRYAIDFIEKHPVSAVLLSMGLGKTIITLTAIADLLFDSFTVAKVLVIAPLRVARDTWPDEIRKWDHLRHLTMAVATGTAAQRKAALAASADITIVNRENVEWLVAQDDFRWDMVVIDELSSFKSREAKRFKALMKMRPGISRIVGLTGTPSSNGLMDLWAQFRLLDMGARLGKFITEYRDRFFTPDKRNGMVVYSYKPKAGAEEAIYRLIGDITISMKSEDHLKMPELVMVKKEVSLSKDEMLTYRSMKDDLVLTLPEKEITAMNAASLSNKLSQMANGAVYDSDGGIVPLHDRKLDALEDIVESMNGKPLMVAYWFKHDRERIVKRFPGVREIRTSRDIEDWNAGRIHLALIHPASAGHGLNLQQGGSTLVWFGLTWSLELYQQTNARLWRQGQSSSTVVIQHIIAKGTIDERIMQALEHKNSTQAALIAAVKAEI